MKKDYYKILGVDKNASVDDIKKAFRKLAGQHHPDRGGSEEKFKEVNEAYQVLSNVQKRGEYDTYGQTFSGNGRAGGNAGSWDFSGFSGHSGAGQDWDENMEFDLGDIFSDLFSGRSGSARGGGRGARRGKDISIDVEIPFEESVFGATRSVLVNKTSSCLSCGGSGATPGSKSVTCAKCSGRGVMKEARRTFFGAVTVETACRECSGSGRKPESSCKSCSGTGATRRSEEIRIDVPPGIENGEMIRLSGMGEYISAGIPGDMYVKIHVRKHATFRRERADIHMDLPVKLTDALLGATYKIASIDGDNLSIVIPEGTGHGTILKVKDRGVIIGRGRRGDMVIRVAIKMPSRLSRDARELLAKLQQEGL